VSQYKTIEFKDGAVRLIDQRKLPVEEKYNEYRNHLSLGQAIKEMVVRGAPAIGIAAAYGVVLGARAIDSDDPAYFKKEMEEVFQYLASTRPTAVNLFWALNHMRSVLTANNGQPVSELKRLLEEKANSLYEIEADINRRIAENGASLIQAGDTVMTHCNTGVLATVGEYGTALGILKKAHELGKEIRVLAGETRPFLQGARLTTWECLKNRIPVTLITDSMAGSLMRNGTVKAVIVGSDRVAANGDVANKIGTYSLAVLCKEHGIPFYVALPNSTIDFNSPTGDDIPIEQRNPAEVTHVFGQRVAPEGVDILNPAFDVTPNKYITAIITEGGIAYPPYTESLKRVAGVIK
jgi:methylthioribose-1-phosphate isomerase